MIKDKKTSAMSDWKKDRKRYPTTPEFVQWLSEFRANKKDKLVENQKENYTAIADNDVVRESGNPPILYYASPEMLKYWMGDDVKYLKNIKYIGDICTHDKAYALAHCKNEDVLEALGSALECLGLGFNDQRWDWYHIFVDGYAKNHRKEITVAVEEAKSKIKEVFVRPKSEYKK